MASGTREKGSDEVVVTGEMGRSLRQGIELLNLGGAVMPACPRARLGIGDVEFLQFLLNSESCMDVPLGSIFDCRNLGFNFAKDHWGVHFI